MYRLGGDQAKPQIWDPSSAPTILLQSSEQDGEFSGLLAPSPNPALQKERLWGHCLTVHSGSSSPLPEQTPGNVRVRAGVGRGSWPVGLLLPGLMAGLGARVRPADKTSSLTWAPSWAGMDVTKQVNMEPPPQCQLSQSGFSHYLSLSPRERGEGREGILLPDAHGMEMADLGGSGTAEGHGEQPSGPSAPAGSEPFVGAADWDPARLDSALSWPKVQGGRVLWWWVEVGEAFAS